MVSLVLTLNLLATTLPAFGRNEACESPRSTGVAAVLQQVETRARTQVQDLCPDQAASSSAADRTKFLNQVRDRTLATYKARSGNGEQPSNTLENFDRMRLFMALRRGEIKDSPRGLEFVPSVELRHPPGFEKLTLLTPAENDVLQKIMAAPLARANAKLRAASRAQRNRVLTEVGGSLRESIRRAGDLGYERMIAESPEVLYVGLDRNAGKASTAFAAALKTESARLKALKTDPPEPTALSLMYFGPTVVTTLRAHPELCGAFHSVRRELTANARSTRAGLAGVGLAAVGTCLAGAFASAGVLAPICILLSASELAMNVRSALETSGDAQLLYGSVLAGAGTATYADRQSETTGLLVASTLSAAGLAGGLKGVLSRPTPVSPAEAYNESVTRLGIKSTPSENSEAAAALIVPDDSTLYGRYAKRMARDGYDFHVMAGGDPEASAWVLHSGKMVVVPGADDPKVLLQPRKRSSVEHEIEHMRENAAATPASRIKISVMERTPLDEKLRGYGRRPHYTADEPAAHLRGGTVLRLLTRGQETWSLQRGEDIANRTAEIVRDAPNDFARFKSHATISGRDQVDINFASDIKNHLKPRQYEELRQQFPEASTVGQYKATVEVKATDEDAMIREAFETLRAFRRDLSKTSQGLRDQLSMPTYAPAN